MSHSTEHLPILDEVGEELRRRFVAAEGQESRLQRRRSRSWLRARVLLPLATLVVAGSAAAATISLTGGAKPIHAGRYTACPPGESYSASTKTGLVVPQNYPDDQAAGLTTWAVVRCFASLRQAVHAGYKLAPPPAGSTTIRGIYLAKSSAFVRATCARASHMIATPVFCPSILPAPWDDQSTAGAATSALDCPGKGCEHPILAVNGAFLAPTWYQGSGDGIGSVSLWAISTAQESAVATVGLVGCPGAKLNRRTHFRGHPAGWYTCVGTEIVQTSSLLQWRIGQEHYGLMVSGPPGLRQRLTRFIAAHLVELRPQA